MAEGEEQPISKYNSGINIIMRLDELWKHVNLYASVGKFANWNSYLDRIWCELARDLKETEFTKKQEDFSAFDTKIVEIGGFGDNAKDTFNKVDKDLIKNRNKHYKELMNKELFLRRLENHLGKGTAWDEGEGDDFE